MYSFGVQRKAERSGLSSWRCALRIVRGMLVFGGARVSRFAVAARSERNCGDLSLKIGRNLPKKSEIRAALFD